MAVPNAQQTGCKVAVFCCNHRRAWVADVLVIANRFTTTRKLWPNLDLWYSVTLLAPLSLLIGLYRLRSSEDVQYLACGDLGVGLSDYFRVISAYRGV